MLTAVGLSETLAYCCQISQKVALQHGGLTVEDKYVITWLLVSKQYGAERSIYFTTEDGILVG